MPKLSIITINLNNADGLEKTILSVKSQTWKDLEHIVIDGGSRDNSKGIIEKYRNGISYTVSEKDNGIYDAQNKGIQNAKGEYCLFFKFGRFFSERFRIRNSFFEKNQYGYYLRGYAHRLWKWKSGVWKKSRTFDFIFFSVSSSLALCNTD